MLDLSSVNLDWLVQALEDHSYDASWWIDPITGAVEYCSDDEDPEEFEARNLVPIDSLESRDAYGDMVDFTNRVRDAHVRDLLTRSLQGRGAFRRFKDTLYDLDDIRAEWFEFHDRRMHARAIKWLLWRDLVSEEVADEALADLDDDADGFGPLGVADIAGVAADGLRDLFGGRLVKVLLYGSQARGDAGPESDIDLLVVLGDMSSPWDELHRMDDLLWRLSLQHGVTLSALPVSENDFEHARVPVMIEARSHGVVVG